MQLLGDRLIRYSSGLSGPVEDNPQFDPFRYRPVMQGTGVFKISVEGYDHQAVIDLHAKIGECPGVDERSEPVVFSWLVFGRADPMTFTITCTGEENRDSVMAWLASKPATARENRGTWSVREVEEDVTTTEEIADQRQRDRAERLPGLRKLVELGILEPFE